MKKFNVHLLREYSVDIIAENGDAAKELVEFYVSGGTDDSKKVTRLKENFQIVRIKPINNEALVLDEI